MEPLGLFDFGSSIANAVFCRIRGVMKDLLQSFYQLGIRNLPIGLPLAEALGGLHLVESLVSTSGVLQMIRRRENMNATACSICYLLGSSK